MTQFGEKHPTVLFQSIDHNVKKVGAGRVLLIDIIVHPANDGDSRVCESCGAVQDVDCVVGQAPCLTPSDDKGFQVREAEVTFWGLCAQCQRP